MGRYYFVDSRWKALQNSRFKELEAVLIYSPTEIWIESYHRVNHLHNIQATITGDQSPVRQLSEIDLYMIPSLFDF